MILAENRYTLFRIMLQARAFRTDRYGRFGRHPSPDNWALNGNMVLA